MTTTSDMARLLMMQGTQVPDAGLGPVTNTTRAGRPNPMLTAPHNQERPADYMAPVAELLSIPMGAYGAGQLVGSGINAAREGDYASGAGQVALGMAGMLPMAPKGGLMAKKKTFADLMAEAALQGMPEDKTTADLLNVPLSRGAILPLTEYLDRAEFDLSSGLPGAFADAVTAPARAARGEISEAEQIPEAFNFAGSLTLGSLLAPRPTGSIGMGGGPTKKQFREYLNKKFPFNPSENNRRGSSGNYGQRGADYGDYLWRNDRGQFDFEYAEWLKKQGNDGGSELSANAKTGAAVPLATRALEAQQPQGIRAFHGSPHDFERFDMSKIGTGEGAQAYGHGLYFAEAEDVAKAYRDGLAKLPEPDAQAMQSVQGKLAELDAQIAEYEPYAASSPAMQRQIGLLNDSRDALLRQAAEETQARAPSGHMYEVNIRADPQDFLDYDAGISRQPEKVRQALSKIADDAGIPRGGFGDEIRSGDLDTLRTYVEQSLPRGEFEKRLKDLGIPGIRYLDQMSRGAGEGSSNYVVFDDQLIEILRKYGLLGPVAGGGTLAGMLMGGQGGDTY